MCKGKSCNFKQINLWTLPEIRDIFYRRFNLHYMEHMYNVTGPTLKCNSLNKTQQETKFIAVS